jgi:DEAD/DEAH box helicase domain-containing protein
MIVVDEAHMYRGVFGSHVACVFRRLFRLCALHGSNPQVVCCSATIQNPNEHFRLLFPRLPPPETVHSEANNQNNGAAERVEVLAVCVPPANASKPTESPPNFHFFRARELKVITEDGAPRSEKLFCMWNPRASPADSDQLRRNDAAPITTQASKPKKRKRTQASASESEHKSDGTSQSEAHSMGSDGVGTAIKDDEPVSRTTSAIFHSARIFSRLMEAEVHTLLFCRGRKLSELVLMTVHSVLGDGSSDPSSKTPLSSTARQRAGILKRISTYRGGYTVDDRRAIERRLFNGDLLGVIATNALELGIDVGALDCTVHLGLPTSVASLWQQAGRAGRQRSAQSSTAVIVCFDAPLDQYFCRHAQELFRLPPEAVALNPNNEKILSQHLVCAARETPLYSPQSGLSYIDSFVFGPLGSTKVDSAMGEHSLSVRAVLTPLLDERKLMRWSEPQGESYRVHACAPKTGSVSLRSINEISYTVRPLPQTFMTPLGLL